MFEALVEFLMDRPESRTKLIAEHRNDGAGKCRGCAAGLRPRPPWPCLLRMAADTAERLATA